MQPVIVLYERQYARGVRIGYDGELLTCRLIVVVDDVVHVSGSGLNGHHERLGQEVSAVQLQQLTSLTASECDVAAHHHVAAAAHCRDTADARCGRLIPCIVAVSYGESEAILPLQIPATEQAAWCTTKARDVRRAQHESAACS